MIELHLDVVDRSHDGIAELAAKIGERSPALHQNGLTAEYDGKRRIPEIARLNYSLKGTTLAPKSEKALRRGHLLGPPKGSLQK